MPAKKPSPAQIRARANFIKMVKERARLRAAGKLPPVTRRSKAAKVKTKRKMGKPSPAQLAARAKFVAMVRARAKKKNRRNAGDDSSVKSPTRTSSDVRSPTRTATSTEAQTSGNVTVTGGAGKGATTRVSIHTPAPRAMRETVGRKKVNPRKVKRKRETRFDKPAPRGPRKVHADEIWPWPPPNKKPARKNVRKRNPGVIKMSAADLKRFGSKIKGLTDVTAPAVRRTTTTVTKRRKTFKKKTGIFGGSGFLGLGRSTRKIKANPVVRTAKTACPNCKARRVIMDGKVTRCVDCGVRRNPKRFALIGGTAYAPENLVLPGARKRRRQKKAGVSPTRFESKRQRRGRKTREAKIRIAGHSLGLRSLNPAASRVYSEFRGKSVSSKSKVRAAVGTPKTLAKLGSLRELKLRGRTLRFGGSASLAADGRKKLHVVGARFKVRGNPGGETDMGEILAVTYRSEKPHIEKGVLDYVHKFGEEGGTRPHLIIDPDGFGKIEGGSYGITGDGIID